MKDEFKKLKINYKEEFDLTNYNTMKLNSMCYVIVYPENIQELKSVVSIIKKYNTKYFVLGNGSNTILPEYYDGVVISLTKSKGFKKTIISGNEIYIESGCMLNKIAKKLSDLEYTGIEWATGIPGTIGGAIYGNAGAYKSSMADIVESVMIFDGKDIIELSNKDLKFDYRYSLLKEKSNYIVLSCKILLNKGNITDIKYLIKERTKKRVESQPLEYPSYGSVFRNPPDLYAGKLIEDIGLKGYRMGDAVISDKHANFIVNYGNARSKDIIKLIKYIRKEVKKEYNIDLVLEQEIIK